MPRTSRSEYDAREQLAASAAQVHVSARQRQNHRPTPRRSSADVALVSLATVLWLVVLPMAAATMKGWNA